MITLLFIVVFLLAFLVGFLMGILRSTFPKSKERNPILTDDSLNKKTTKNIEGDNNAEEDKREIENFYRYDGTESSQK